MPRARRRPQPGRRPDARRDHVPLVRTRPHAAAVRHGPAHCRRKREGATLFPTIGLFERNANNLKGTRNTKAQKSRSSRAEPEVRIHLPPADSPSLSRIPLRRSRTPAFRAVLFQPEEERSRPLGAGNIARGRKANAPTLPETAQSGTAAVNGIKMVRELRRRRARDLSPALR